MTTISFEDAAQQVLDSLLTMSKEELSARLAAQSDGPFSCMAKDMAGFTAFLATEEGEQLLPEHLPRNS